MCKLLSTTKVEGLKKLFYIPLKLGKLKGVRVSRIWWENLRCLQLAKWAHEEDRAGLTDYEALFIRVCLRSLFV